MSSQKAKLSRESRHWALLQNQIEQATYLYVFLREVLGDTNATAVILVESDLSICPSIGLVMANPISLTLPRVSCLNTAQRQFKKVHPSAIISNDAAIHDTAIIGAHVVIEDGVEIGESAIISPNCSIGQSVKIGDRARISSNVVLYAGVELGNDCEINSGTVIGSPGFGFAPMSMESFIRLRSWVL